MRNLKINWKKMLAMAGISIVLLTTAGCSKKADCNVPTYHAHRYVNQETQMTRFVDKEYLSYEGYERQEDYVTITENERRLYQFFDKKNLLRIDDNIEAIINAQANNQDFIEYRYAYTYLMPIPIVHSNGKTTTVTFMYVPQTHYSWTTNPNHSRLTGETRLCHYEYTSYRIDIDEKGNYILVPGNEKQNIIATRDEYPYILEKFYKIVNLADGYEVDYEDMENDEVEHIQEEENTEEKTLSLTK